MNLLGGHSRARKTLRRVSALLAVLGIAATVWLLPSPGDASAALQTAQPDRSAHLGRAPDHVRLGFAQAPAPGSLTKVVVLSPQDENLARGPALTSAAGVTQPVAALGERGAYQVAYEVHLVDGNVARGEYWFWYAPTASGSRSPLLSAGLVSLFLVVAAALVAALLASGRTRRSAVLVPAQRTAAASPTTATSTTPVPTQRSRDIHLGPSPPGNAPRPRSAPGRVPDEPTKPAQPRQD